MDKLTASQESFVVMMTTSEELARRGFDLLLKRTDFHQFFDHLEERRPIRSQSQPGSGTRKLKGGTTSRTASALDYLTAVAKLSGATADSALGNKVMKWCAPLANGEHRRDSSE